MGRESDKYRRVLEPNEMVKYCLYKGTDIRCYKQTGSGKYRVRFTQEKDRHWLEKMRGENPTNTPQNCKAEKPSIEEKEDDKILLALKERYSKEELNLLIKGEGLHDKNSDYAEIHLHGNHHKIGVISDTHWGSKYTPEEWCREAFKTFEQEQCECVLHCGDLTDGLCPSRAKTHIYELSQIGYSAQKIYAVRMLSLCKLPIYVLSGNHDSWYKDVGADIVEDVCEEVDNAIYIGNNQADIDIDGIKIRLFHGLDGSSYAVSYRLQKIVEGFSGGNKPNILLCGHTHKYCNIFERNIQVVSIPSLQAQTPWMAGKKLSAHTGFVIIDFDVFDKQVCNFKVQLFPYY